MKGASVTDSHTIICLLKLFTRQLDPAVSLKETQLLIVEIMQAELQVPIG